jgi:hypothetical protein
MSVRRGVLAMSLLGLVGCGAARRRVRSGPRSPSGTISAPARYAPPAAALDRAALRSRLPTDHRLTPDELVAQHAVRFTGEVGAEPDDVEGMSAVQGGPFALRGAELEHLRARGFTLAPRLRRPNFLSGYVSLYVADQPVYLSADVILNALHESFDALVADIEEHALARALSDGLAAAHGALAGPAGAALSAETRGDLDTYLAVARGLLAGSPVAPVAGADAAAIEALVAGATAGTGTADLTLFGSRREVDLSQMRPRGHYAGEAARERYFRAVMFLGREGLRLVDVVAGERVLRRRQVAAALGLRALSDAGARAAFTQVERAIGAFAGEPEALTFSDLDALAAAIDRAPGGATDAQVLALIDAGRGDRPRVATAMLVHPDGFDGTVPQPVTFSLTPQRYTPDAMVLSRVSFDRVDRGRVPRMMPDALDAAFAALGNDQAAVLLGASLARHDYATELEGARALVDAHEAAYWGGSLYAAWTAALRTLSPRETLAEGGPLPATMTTEAWGRRLLNTQMAAWAEARHDMVLYAAQSYTVSLGCSYPQAYVEPYPAAWSALGRWTESAQALVASVAWRDEPARARWTRWAAGAREAVRRLQEIAERERGGDEPTDAQLAWVNQALNARMVNVVCATELRVDGGWLYDLYEPRMTLGADRAIVADVHTQPEDESGARVGRVLHIGTAAPQAMVVVAGAPGRERAYVGFASSYRERVTGDFDRLTDERWRREAALATSPAWLAPVTASEAPPR